MLTFLTAFLVFLLAVAGMAVGVVLAGRRLQGSCGGNCEIGCQKKVGCPLDS